MPSWWTLAWPGICATVTGVGFARFSYTAIIPFLVGTGQVTAPQADYLGAANLAGYFAGALVAHQLALRTGNTLAIRGGFILTILGLGLSAVPGGFWWLMPWRFLVGLTGGVLMVLAPSFLLIQVPAAGRGRAGGVIYAGVGLGAGLGSLIVAPLALISPILAWLGLTAGAVLASAVSWSRWRGGFAPTKAHIIAHAPLSKVLTLPLILGCLAFATDGAGFIPHSVFWVDFVARELGLGTSIGSITWLLFGLGAVFGPSLAGALGDRIGLGRAYVVVFVMKAIAIALPWQISSVPALALSALIVGALTPAVPAVLSARITELVPAREQSRAWGWATLCFAVAQAGGAYGLSFAYEQIGIYRPLYLVGALIEASGAVFALLALSQRPLTSDATNRRLK
ncbi:MAG TPA: YbfB/YjiJ family MFS transporter [Stellaceae bacterium]|nr:YbfB/YjiJ family MFS transporter [Stellaceae bacterium]